MRKLTPLDKMSKKSRKAFHTQQRGSWNGLSPVTRIVPNKKAYIRKLEAGVRIPSLDMLLKLSAALNTTPNHLLLSASNLGKNVNASILDLLSDCTPSEFFVLYENMSNLKELLRERVK